MNTKTLTRTLTVILAALFLTACSLSPEQVAEKVKEDMANSPQFKEKGITVKEFTVTPKEENKYEGILKTEEPGGEAVYRVEVIHEGSSLNWKIVEHLNK
ncbi:hypothetical protein MASR1M107_18890 [Ignavibacteriales bacterium]